MQPALQALAVIALALAGLLVLEVRVATPPPDISAPQPGWIVSQTQHSQAAQIAVSPSTAAAWRDIMLGRPLFAPTRRPPAALAETPTAPVEVPRLSGIMVTPTTKIAVFSPATGAPIIVTQNSRFGPFTVLAIRPDSVTMQGPSGVMVLRSNVGAPRPPDMPTSTSTVLAGGIYLNLIKVAIPNTLTWPEPPPSH